MSASRLPDVLDQQAVEDRRRALRALLRHALLRPDSPDGKAFALVRKHSAWLRDWFANETGWALQVDASLARLRKIPGSHGDGTRGAQAPQRGSGRAGTVTFNRRRYVLACLALAALERSEAQVTLGWLVERVLALAADPELTAAGIAFTLDTRDERSDLVAVARLLLSTGVLTRVAGDEQAFVEASGDALYDVDRRVLAAVLVARRGPSTVPARDFEERLRAITEEMAPDTGDGRNRAIRHSLARRLLDDPVLFYTDLTEEERSYLNRQRGQMLRRLTEATGLVAEVRAEGVALLDPTREATDLGMPEEGTDGHATLLLAEYLAGTLRDDRTEPVTTAELTRQMVKLAETHRKHWRKAATEPGAERALTTHAVSRLEALGLVRRRGADPETVAALPALGRFAYGEATILGTRTEGKTGATTGEGQE